MKDARAHRHRHPRAARNTWAARCDFIHDHHEHWDGSGYPRGLAGDAISCGGRVLTAADAFDALTSKRAYRDPMTAEAALSYLATQRGRLIEPAMYDALVEAVQVEYRLTA